MSETPEVLSRAGSLMMRGRSFVANRPAPPGSEKTNRPAEDEDLPVLTEIVPADAPATRQSNDRDEETQTLLITSEIAHAFGEQLTSDLPALLESALSKVREELHAGIGEIMETAVRNVLARRRQLDLPLEETNSMPEPGQK